MLVVAPLCCVRLFVFLCDSMWFVCKCVLRLSAFVCVVCDLPCGGVYVVVPVCD